MFTGLVQVWQMGNGHLQALCKVFLNKFGLRVTLKFWIKTIYLNVIMLITLNTLCFKILYPEQAQGYRNISKIK